MKMKYSMTNALIAVSLALGVPASFAGNATGEAAKTYESVLTHYLSIQEALASDSTTGIKKAADSIVVALKSAPAPGELAAMRAAAEKISKTQDIEQIRTEFKALSRPITDWAAKNQNDSVEAKKCGMQKAAWVQKKGEIRNPYYGKKMLKCGMPFKKKGMKAETTPS